MQGAGVEEGRRAAAEAAVLVEAVEAGDLGFAVALFIEHQAHGHAQPEKLGRLDAAVLVAGLVDDEVAIVKGLNTKEVEFQVGGGIEGSGELLEVVFEEAGIEALDGDAVFEVFLEGALMNRLEGSDAISHYVPTEDFLIKVGQLDAAGELGEIGILFDQGLRIEDDGRIEVLLRDLVVSGAAQLDFDLLVGEVQVQADAGELDALAEIFPIPKLIGAIGLDDHDHRSLGGSINRRSGVLEGPRLTVIAGRTALGAEQDVGLCHLEMAGFHEFLLHHVLNLLDVHEGLLGAVSPGRHGFGDGNGRGGIALEGQEGLADGDLNLLFAPRHDLIVTPNDPQGGNRRAGAVDGDLARPIEQETLGDKIVVVVDQGFLNELVEGVER